MKLTIDFETRSKALLKKCGAWVYSQHSSTEIFCIAVKENYDSAVLFANDAFAFIYADEYPVFNENKLLKEMFGDANIIEAHNAFFERCLWENIKVPRYGFPSIPPEKWRCSAAKAAALALPRSLGDAGAALGLTSQKDKEGHRIMMKLSRPRTPTKNNPSEWHEDPEDFKKLFEYCIQDVEAEHALSEALPDLSPVEQKVWFLDQKINHRGFFVDVDGAAAAIRVIEKYGEDLLSEFKDITGAGSPRQVTATLIWLKSQGVELPNLQKETVGEKLKQKGIPDKVRRVLEIRQALSKSSTAKYKAMITSAGEDCRIRDTYLYHGASTGRWAGRNVQPQNLPKGNIKNTDVCIEYIKNEDRFAIEFFYNDLMSSMKSCIRGMITAPGGKELMVVDYASIEGRALAWLAGEEKILQDYIDGKCPYCAFASQFHPHSHDEILAGYKRGDIFMTGIRFEGKTGELACGYQGGEKSVWNFAPKMLKSRRQEIVDIWRDNRPETVRFWRLMDTAAIKAVDTGNKVSWRNISYFVKGDFLFCKLPSGRRLAYYKPELGEVPVYAYSVKDENGDISIKYSGRSSEKEGIRCPDKDFSKLTASYLGIESESKARVFRRIYMYGGKWAQHITQATAADFQRNGMLGAEGNGYPIVAHTHDEIISEIPRGFGSVREFENIVSEVPGWAVGLPIAAEGFRTKRYRKG